MNAARRPSVTALVNALICSTTALVFAAHGATLFAVAAALFAAALIAIELVRISLAEPPTDPVLLARFMEHVEAGRRLAIYDRETGLFAHWYVALRGQEECARSERYDRKLSLLIVEPCADSANDAWAIKSRIGRWIENELRATDLAGYLGNSRYAVISPEADGAAVDRLVERLRAEVEDIDVGVSTFPEDGVNFAELWQRAAAQLTEQQADAA